MKGIKHLIRFHPNYLFGFCVWLFAILSVVFAPRFGIHKIFQKKCKICDKYSRFVANLSPEQKAQLGLFEAGLINIDDKFYFIGGSSNDEFHLYKNERISYKVLNPIIDEKLRRIIVVNSLINSMLPEERDMILNKRAVVIYRNAEYLLIKNLGMKSAIEQ